MPFSSNNGKSTIKWVVEKTQPKLAFDVGPGVGTYAKMFPAITWDAVEIFEPYLEKHNLPALYRDIRVDDARKVVYAARTGDVHMYDLVMFGDVLEHMKVSEAMRCLAMARELCPLVIVSIPLGSYPQGAYEGNEHEAHISDNWTVDDFHATFGPSDFHQVEGEIGVFVYASPENARKLRLKIAVTAICKNEEAFVDRFMDACVDADMVIVGETGSTDDTKRKLIARQAVVHDIVVTPWRFDIARNAVHALVPRDVDVCVALDLDEMLVPGWREEIERVWKPGITNQLQYMFDWGHGFRFIYEKIFARHGFHWHHPCHEYPRRDARVAANMAHTDMLMVEHHPDPTKSRGQYLDLLALSVKEDPACGRNAFYYARELSFHKHWAQSLAQLDRYLNLPDAQGAGRANERCYAYRVAAKCHDALGNRAEEERALYLAANEAPNTREPWFELSALYYRRLEWPLCYAMAMKCLAITDRNRVYTQDPVAWGGQPHDYAAIAAYYLNMKAVALDQAKAAVALEPDNERFLSNLRIVEIALADKLQPAS